MVISDSDYQKFCLWLHQPFSAVLWQGSIFLYKESSAYFAVSLHEMAEIGTTIMRNLNRQSQLNTCTCGYQTSFVKHICSWNSVFLAFVYVFEGLGAIWWQATLRLAVLAQMVACLPLVQQVRGSIPGGVENFNLKIFNLGARRGGDTGIHFLIARLYVTSLDWIRNPSAVYTLRRHIVLLIAIRPLGGDVKPGGPLGAFREEQTMSRHRVSPSPFLSSSSSHITQ